MSIRGSAQLGVLFAVLQFCFALFLPPNAGATIHHPGKWTSDSLDFNGTAVNMMIVPDGGAGNHSRIIWWADEHGDVYDTDGLAHAGRFAWRPVDEDSANSGHIPHQNFAPMPMEGPNFNYFCSSMGYLSDGNIVVCGGTTEAENGENHAAIYFPEQNLWRTLPNVMHTGRWYPSLTTLSNGKVLVSSGSRYRHMWVFGGGTATDSNLYRVPVSHSFGWEAGIMPSRDESKVESRPIPRRGHTATWSIGSRQAYFGGVNLATGAYLQDTWLLVRDFVPTGVDYQYFWQKRTPENVAPSARAFHVAAVLPSSGSKRTDTETLVLMGGQVAQAGPNSVAGDVWCGVLKPGTWKISWQPTVTLGDTVLTPRYGHAAYWHKGHNRFYVYGGCGSSGVPTDTCVYSMEFVDSVTVRWHICRVENPLDAPAPRRGMATGPIEAKYLPNTAAQGLMMFGGRTSSNELSDSLVVLWFTGQDTVRWQHVPQSGASRPPALEWASGTANGNAQEFWVLGGKDASGQPCSAQFSFNSRCIDCTTTLNAGWESRSPAPAPLWGHTAPQHEVEMFSATPELLNPADSTFTELAGARLLQDWYPQMFVLPSGGIFAAGPSKKGSLLTLSGASATRDTFPSVHSTFRGGSAVMYRPGKIMKCGSRDTDNKFVSALGSTQFVNLNAGNPQWINSSSMRPRVNFNLIVLPDGKVLSVGGSSYLNNDDNTHPIFQPEIWNPDADNGAGLWEGGVNGGA